MPGFVHAAFTLLVSMQTGQATLTGVVRDRDTGAPIPGALVALTDLDRAVVTGEDGRYRASHVAAGPQHVEVRVIGYAAHTLHALIPATGTLELNVALAPEAIPMDPLRVHAPMPMRGVEPGDTTPFPDLGLSMATLRNNPMLAEPDALQALSGSVVTIDPEAPAGVHIRGGASDQTAYLLDGIPVFSPYHAGGLFGAWNPDALSRIEVDAASPSPGLPETLSGAIVASTRVPGATLRGQGGLTTTQARAAFDGPLIAGVGWLLSGRIGYPDALAPRDEPSYVRGRIGDWLAKLEAPTGAGRVRLLGYLSENRLDAAATVGVAEPRNAFEWDSRSFGADWTWRGSRVGLHALAWHAQGSAAATWASPEHGTTELDAVRRDIGALLALDLPGPSASSALGLRAERIAADYDVLTDSARGTALRLGARTPVVTLFGTHRRALGSALGAEIGGSIASHRESVHASPRVELRWIVSERVTISASAARMRQFAQSLRNAESIVGHVFPADLYVAADEAGVPVARSDQAVLAGEWRPRAGLRAGVQAYARDMHGLVLVAPGEGEPFAIDGFTTGGGNAGGVAADVALASARYGLLASWVWQRVRLEYNDTAYTPDHGSAHVIEGGVVVFPSATSSVRIGANAALGRRGTLIGNGIDWESCNLLDEGCEFSGSPSHAGQPLGGESLPAYIRVDLGARKHWHITPGGRDASLALYGTVSNLFGFGNVLAYSVDPETGERSTVEMRPFAPLVIGLDWRF